MVSYKSILLILLTPLLLSQALAYNTTLYLFWGEGCPHCAHEKEFLMTIGPELSHNLTIKTYEVWYNESNRELFYEMANAYSVDARGVPVTFVGDKSWIGYDDYMGPQIKQAITNCINDGCTDPITRLTSTEVSNETLSPAHAVCIHLFTTGECTQCNDLNSTLTELINNYNIDVVIHKDEPELFNQFKEFFDLTTTGYPIAFIGDNYLVGYSSINNNLEGLINECLTNDCPCPAESVNGVMSQMPGTGDITPENNTIIQLPLIGEVDSTSMSLYFVTFLISIMDGFNPCSLWLITFLLGIVIYTGSRKKIIIIGLTFLITITLVYGLFMLGLVNVFYYVNQLFWIRLIIGLIALLFAVVNIKDYFWYKKGISFTISDDAKPGIYKRVRNIMNPENTLIGMIIATIVLALGVTLVELPCTVGLPMIWTNVMAMNNVKGLEFGIHLGIYLAVFIVDELIVLLTAAFTLKVSKFEEKHGRILKLFGGLIMLFLGLAMILTPQIMDDLTTTIIFFLIAVVVTWLVNYLYNKYSKKTKMKKVVGAKK